MNITIVGGGQLARMLAHAGIPLGIECTFILKENESDLCIKNLGKYVRYTRGMDFETLYQALNKPAVVTIENENVDTDLLEGLSKFCTIYPNLNSINIIKNRLNQKNFLKQNTIDTADFFSFSTFDEFSKNINKLNLPLVIKACNGGYDGKNQYVLKTKQDFLNFKHILNMNYSKQDQFIAEDFINFSRELSFICARSASGETKFYAATENFHKNGILIKSIAPAQNIDQKVAEQAHNFLKKITSELDYVGILAMECFEIVNNGRFELLVNELAPRVHNSGHWTQTGCSSSQFENHLRAILDLKLGSVDSSCINGMLNILGKNYVSLNLLNEKACLHWYNKEVRENRKMGHINFTEHSYEALSKNMDDIYQSIQNCH